MKTFPKAALGAAAVIPPLVAPALAEYPERPLQFVVPRPPGDLDEVLARLIAETLQEMARAVRAGVVHVNTYGGDIAVPLSGFRQSGFGRESRHALDEYPDLKTARLSLS